MRWKRALTVVGVHAEGEYGKVITGGVVDVPGKTMFDKMVHLRDHDDGLRKFLLFEPRGAAVHGANLVLPSNNPKAQAGYIIMESTEYPPMSGSNTICTVTAILETGILPMKEPITELTLETPAGLVYLTCRCEKGKVLQVKFKNVPSFVQVLDANVEVKGVGTVKLDVAYGGMHYALIDAASVGAGAGGATGVTGSRGVARTDHGSRHSPPVEAYRDAFSVSFTWTSSARR